ncbi:MAG TPA: hypothetical protein VG961_14445 [Ignavibacteria bacterium]|nr:hypothetical protein [Ignavibacteria bacterium]
MQGIQLLEHNYAVYIALWFLMTLFILWFFRFMTRKMRNTDDRQTKSSLFTITMFFGIPLLLTIVVGPLFFLIGDKNMESEYRYLWLGLIGAFLIYFIFKQKNPNSGK